MPSSTLTPSPALAPSPAGTAIRPTPVPSRTERAATATAVPVPARATPVPEASHGGTLNLASRENILHQDVHDEISPALSTWGPGIVYSRLLRFKSGPDVDLPSLAVECEVCESWEMEDDTTFVFRLREGVRWQGLSPVNGRVLTADDVVFSYNRQREPGRPNAPLLGLISTLEAPAPNILRVSLLAPDADLLVSLADGHSKIVAPEAVELSGDLREGPTIGTGPWMLTGSRTDGAHTFERNPDYFEDGLPYLDGITIHIITDPAARDAAFRVSLIDVQQMEAIEWDEFKRQHPGAPFMLTQDAGTGLEVALKASSPLFRDLGVRRAVFQAMDPWQAIDDLWLGTAFVSLGLPVSDADWLLPERELREHFGHPDLARDLLRESDARLPLSVTIKVGDFGEPYLAHAQRIADEVEAVGFEPALEVVNRRAFGDDVWLGGNYVMFVGPTAPVTAPNNYLLPVLHSRGRWNTAGFEDPELDRLIEAQALEYDSATRRELVQQVQRTVLDNAYRFMPATHVSAWTWSSRVKNLHLNPAGFEYSHWSRVWLSE